MVKRLLSFFVLGVIGMAITIEANADNRIYVPADGLLGQMFGVSSNGKWAAGCDDLDATGGYVWNIDNPDEFVLLPDDGQGRDVTDDGMVVGNFDNGENGTYNVAGYYKDGVWNALPLSDQLIGTSTANRVSPDGKYIGGTQFCYDAGSEIGGRYYPCLWTRDDATGEYLLDMYNDIDLPDHQGFLTNAMSDDGRIFAGRLYCGSSSMVPALIVDGQPKFFNTFETRIEPFEYKGEIIGEFEEYYIDGNHDTGDGHNFNGEFCSMDQYGNCYGYRTRVFDVDESTGYGTLVSGACIYNYNTDEWIDDTENTVYFSGINGDYLSGYMGDMLVGGEATTVKSAFGVTTGLQISGVVDASDDGRVLVGATIEFNEAIGDYMTAPFVIVLEKPLVETSGISVLRSEKVSIVVSEGRIDVVGAADVAVYTIGGTLVGNAATSQLPSGIYVVKADEVVRKVTVR